MFLKDWFFNWRLKKQDASKVDLIPQHRKIVKAKIIEVYDGDTCKVIYRNGTKYFKISIRIKGIDTPEIKGKGVQPYEKEAAEKIRDYVRNLILGKIKYIYIEKWDKYGGRVVGEVFLQGKKYSLSDHLLVKNFAKEYDGGKKQVWTREQCENIIRKL